VAGGLMLVAAVVISDSMRVGIGWADDGPRAGYFPFYIGLLLLAGSASVFISQLWRWRRSDPLFARRDQLRLVVSVFVPTMVYVAAIFAIGIYFASMLLIGYFMRRYGKYRWHIVAAVSIAVPLIFFIVFERWFLVPLPKGPIENWLGF
jgi:hypothetical protein